MPSCDLFTSLALLSSFGRETSLVKVMGPRSIFPPLFTPSIYFESLLSVAIISCVDPLYKARPEELTTPLYSLGAKLLVVCAGPRQPCLHSATISGAVDTYLSFLESYWSILNLSIFAKGNLLLCYIKPSTCGNQRAARSHQAISGTV